jgi:hypothetical protein
MSASRLHRTAVIREQEPEFTERYSVRYLVESIESEIEYTVANLEAEVLQRTSPYPV